jgi:HEPN domain-containing protein
MNEAQELWWEQAKSDLAVFVCLRRVGVHPCHMLHYLQMAAEKISKAYLWRSGTAPPRSHVGLMRFLRALLGRSRSRADLQRIAEVFEFTRPRDMDAWVRQIAPFASDLQNLAPAEANDGPNPEYPWPHEAPKHCPATHSFELWARLRDHQQGRTLLKFIEHAINRFDQYA